MVDAVRTSWVMLGICCMLANVGTMGHVEGWCRYCVDVVPINGYYATYVVVTISELRTLVNVHGP